MTDPNQVQESQVLRAALASWFSTPPRAHGELEQHRTVSFVELFYDLVFVVLIAQLGHALAGHIDWTGLTHFSILFALVWIAWLNGSMYHDVHGRNDGRSRTYIFLQMPLLALMAAFSGHALDADSTDGLWFSVLYASVILMVARQWWVVRRYDQSAEDRTTVARWVGMHVLIAAAVLTGGFLGEPARSWIWAATVLVWISMMILQGVIVGDRITELAITESGAERFGLLTIIVLGEIVTGVVNGMLESEITWLVAVTVVLALFISFGFWWNYFDAVGRVLPKRNRWAFGAWTLIHLPLTASIAAAGAGMVSLVEDAAAAHTPPATAWLLAGSSASMLIWVAAMTFTVDYEDAGRAGARPQLAAGLAVGALASLLVGWWAPAPWLLALALVAVHSTVWICAFIMIAKARAKAGLGAPQLD